MHKIILIILFNLLLSGCFLQKKDTVETPSKVELKKIDNTYRLYVNNQAFYVKGAGLEHGDIKNLASHGANSFRTWRTDNENQSAKEVLDEAHQNNLMVLMGIEIGRERHGYDYNDSAWVATQFESVKKQVVELKDHPALLAWAIGNELNHHNENMNVWRAVNDISKMIHEVDGNHPTTTTFAGFSKNDVEIYNKYCNDLDFISIQMYGDIINLQKRISDAGYHGAYMVTEWGATGHWEMPATKFGMPIEQTSSEKANSVKERWYKAIKIDDKNCLGSYIFLWGQKQERTPTWYGLFTEDNDETAVIDFMHEVWTGTKPKNICPEIDEILLNKKTRFENICLMSDTKNMMHVSAHDPDNDSLKMYVEVLKDIPENFGEGGDFEKRSKPYLKTEEKVFTESFNFISPNEEGTYRILIYITDGNKNAATANIPFYVSENCK